MRGDVAQMWWSTNKYYSNLCFFTVGLILLEALATDRAETRVAVGPTRIHEATSTRFSSTISSREMGSGKIIADYQLAEWHRKEMNSSQSWRWRCWSNKCFLIRFHLKKKLCQQKAASDELVKSSGLILLKIFFLLNRSTMISLANRVISNQIAINLKLSGGKSTP